MNKEGYDWIEIVERNPQGYFELQDPIKGTVIHGPIKSIVIDDYDNVIIELKWVAQMGLPGTNDFGTWKKTPDKLRKICFPNLVVPFIYENTPEKGERIIFAAGRGLLYFDKIAGVDPANVQGLEITEE